MTIHTIPLACYNLAAIFMLLILKNIEKRRSKNEDSSSLAILLRNKKSISAFSSLELYGNIGRKRNFGASDNNSDSDNEDDNDYPESADSLTNEDLTCTHFAPYCPSPQEIGLINRRYAYLDRIQKLKKERSCPCRLKNTVHALFRWDRCASDALGLAYSTYLNRKFGSRRWMDSTLSHKDNHSTSNWTAMCSYSFVCYIPGCICRPLKSCYTNKKAYIPRVGIETQPLPPGQPEWTRMMTEYE